MKDNKSFLNNVNNRFLPLPRSAMEHLEHEPKKEDFDFIKELGIGTFGIVYLVVHKKTKVKYALKYIDKDDPENIKEKANFKREIEIMYKLNHPNIVKLYGHFEDNKYCYFIMQYIPKRTVFELIPKRQQKPNLKLIASIMKDIISAVYYLHNMKPTIIHRDIKPENILLDECNRAYLTDFGWSNYKMSNRRRKTICGTPLYLPPEMVNNVGHDETVDIWCIGVLLFELLTGNTPFQGNDFVTVTYNICNLNISWPPMMDPDAKDVISKILKLNSKERLPLEKILAHNFFTKFFLSAINELIKPDNQQSKIFVVSTDDPKTYGQQNKQASINSSKTITNNGYHKAYTHTYSNSYISNDMRKEKENNIPIFGYSSKNDKYKRNQRNRNHINYISKDPAMKNKTMLIPKIPRIKIDLSHNVKNDNKHSEFKANKTINAYGKNYNKKCKCNSRNRLIKAIYDNNFQNGINKRSNSNSNGKIPYFYKTPKINRYVSHTNSNSVVLSSHHNISNYNSSHTHNKSYNIYHTNNNYHNHLNHLIKNTNHTYYNSKNNGIPLKYHYKYYIN